MTDSPSEELDAFQHSHDVNGHFIHLAYHQDGSLPPCPDCGLHLPADVRPSAHARACPSYEPDPRSIAGQSTGRN